MVRSLLHRQGFRFRLHQGSLQGKPDIVLKKYRTVILVNGCFWHRHPGCRFSYMPKTRVVFWKRKFQNNVSRDKIVRRLLCRLGWQVLRVWQCELRKPDKVIARLKSSLLAYRPTCTRGASNTISARAQAAAGRFRAGGNLSTCHDAEFAAVIDKSANRGSVQKKRGVAAPPLRPVAIEPGNRR